MHTRLLCASFICSRGAQNHKFLKHQIEFGHKSAMNLLISATYCILPFSVHPSSMVPGSFHGERISLCIGGIPRRSLHEGHGQETNAIIARHLEGLQSCQPMRKPEVTAAKKERKVAEEVIKNSSIYARVACSDVQVISAAGGVRPRHTGR